MMPRGADAVVMQEVTEIGRNSGPDASIVKIFEGVDENQNVRFAGESVKNGALVMEPGKHLRPPEISMLASLNRAEVTVHRKPIVAVVSTGDELTRLGEPLAPGKNPR